LQKFGVAIIVFAVGEVSDFKFGIQLYFAKVHHKKLRGKVGAAVG